MGVNLSSVGFFAVPADLSTYYSYLELGRDGEFDGLLPFRVRDPADLVARHEDVVAALKALPPAGVHRGRSGRRYHYWVDATGRWNPTWEQIVHTVRAAEAGAQTRPATTPPLPNRMPARRGRPSN